MKVIVIIPAFNEERTISQVVSSIPRNCAEEVEVLVVNDGSKDQTAEIAKQHGAKVLSHKTNLGLGTTFKDGINQALKMGADIIVNIDADGQFNPQDIPKLLQPIIDNQADMATCSRFKDPRLIPKMPKLKILGNKFFAKILNFFLNRKFHDTQCGFRAYSREAALNLTLFGKYTYTQEVFIDLIKKGFRIVEVPCKVVGERKGKSRVVKNILSYGFKVSLIIVRSMRDYEPLKFFGLTGLFIFLAGALSSLGLFIRFLLVGRYNPYLSLVYLNVFLIIVGILLVILGLIADMLDRNRILQEEILYRLKKKEYNNKK
ncbi:glycosyltransferase family 2 protein [Candidatus Woesearchaeota archaeon]|jgi:glycosyltransferase involved in cell wall biosynthesis|nr:glycosyltransferase family 2 protein [Candidatus Woesearchaeota archaeon]